MASVLGFSWRGREWRRDEFPLVGTLHLALGIGWLHGALAKALLVRAFAARESAPEPAAGAGARALRGHAGQRHDVHAAQGGRSLRRTTSLSPDQVSLTAQTLRPAKQ